MGMMKVLAAAAIVGIAGISAQAQTPGQWYKLQTMFQAPEGKCFEGNRYAQGSTLGGAAFMDDCQNVSGQLWKFIPEGNGYYRMVTMFQEPEGKCFQSCPDTF